MKESILGKRLLKIPELIDSKYPYVVLADFDHVFNRLSETKLDKELIEIFEDKVINVLGKVSPEMTSFTSLNVGLIIEEVERRITKERNSGDKVGVVQLDRYINGDKAGDYFRLEISRGVSGGLVPRPGCDTAVEDQFKNLAEWVVGGNFNRLLIVDDVLAFGDTLTPMLNGFRELIPNTKLKVLVGLAASGGGWKGLERVLEASVDVEAVTVIKAGDENEWTSGMAMPALRDFTFLGGKILTDKTTGRRLNFPYFLPFSLPVISFMPKEKRYDASLELMNVSIEIVEQMCREVGQDLTMQDLKEAGFGMPSIRMKCLQNEVWEPNMTDSVWKYLQYCRFLLQYKKQEVQKEALL